MTIQICGSISGIPIEKAWEKFNEAESLLRVKYPDMVIINPLRLCVHLTEAFKEVGYEPHYEHYLSVCLASLKHVYMLVCLDNAHVSEGGKREMNEAWALGKEVKSLGDMLR